MPFRIVRYEPTPNPDALKCWLDQPISTGPRSFRSPEEAQSDPLAKALFAEAGLACLLLNGEWMTINRQAGADWAMVKRRVGDVLASAGEQAPTA
jgi:hypothetical protein